MWRRLAHRIYKIRNVKNSFLPGKRKEPKLTHAPKQALQTAGIVPQAQFVPQFYHAQVWVLVAHIPDEFRVAPGMAMGPWVRPEIATFHPSGLSGSGCTSGSCCTSGAHGCHCISLHSSLGLADTPCPVLYSCP